MDNSDFLNQENDIAIIGMSCRFPGAKNIDEFWHNLCQGVESVSFFSDEELIAAGVSLEELRNPRYVKASPVLDDIELFDAAFFKINAREAELMDPQQRLFLLCAAEALESAGYNAEKFAGRIGVYGGTGITSYLLHNLASNRELMQSADGTQLGAANDKDYLSTRVSYKLNLQGPSMTVQTACSTALVATHLACESLLSQECDMALAGGVAISVPMKRGYVYTEGMHLSPDGHCRAFDARAQGTIFGSGVGLVVLRRLRDAVAQRDMVYAVIKGSAVNNDGSLKVGFAAPGVDGQARVIAEALDVAGINPETVSYVETHGSGTALGDPIEVAALTKAFRLSTRRTQFCALGSVKTNVGHLATAAGVAGLIKTVLVLRHGMIPPTLHFKEPNPQIDFASSPFFVNTERRPWPASQHPRRAGVNSFGMGGTNVHLVLEEAPGRQPTSGSRPHQLLHLSAKTEASLEIATSNLVAYLRNHPEVDLADVAYTLQMGRAAYSHRRTAVCQTVTEAVDALSGYDPGRVLTNHNPVPDCPVVFLFPGVGDHYVGMAQELYRTEPEFKKWLDDCCQQLQPYLNIDLRDILYPQQQEQPLSWANQTRGIDFRQMVGRHKRNGNSTEPLQQTALAQPAVFVVEYALAQLLIAYGVKPQAMIGYSLGEYVCACLAGVLTLPDALRLVAERARLIQSLPAGAMLTVSLGAAAMRPFLTDDVVISGILTPRLCVLAGPVAAIAAVQAQLSEQNVSSWLLPATHAFHSPMMAPIEGAFRQLLQTVAFHPPQIPYLSNVTGNWIQPAEATDPAYWTKHLCQTVQLEAGMARLLGNEQQVFLEVGPGQSMGSFVSQHPDGGVTQTMRTLPTLRYAYDQQSDSAFLLNTLGKLWLLGVDIDGEGFYQHESRWRLPLPTYPFDLRPYWIEAPTAPASMPPVTKMVTAKKEKIRDWLYQPAWQQTTAWKPTDKRIPAAEDGPWLLFADQQGCGRRIQAHLQQAGCAVVTIQMGDQFQQLAADVYQLNPQEPEAYRLLLTKLPVKPRGIVHLWGIEPLAADQSPAEQFAQAQDAGLYSLLHLMQALNRHGDALSIWIVTNQAQVVTGVETVAPEKATLSGACRVMAQENPQVTCHMIDIAWPSATEWQGDWLAEQLMAEFNNPTNEPLVAYRNHRRWRQIYEPRPLPAAAQRGLRPQGVYLITGGLGDVGLTLAQHLAQAAQAKIFLTSRSTFPPPGLWADWLEAHQADDVTSRRIRRLQLLQAAGADIQVLQADAANEREMEAAITGIEAQCGQVHGVIHLAGIVSGQPYFAPLDELDQAACEAHFGPKAYGLYVLENVLRDRELDFCLIFSSIASILGGVQFGAYAAANAFVDAFTQQHNQQSRQEWLTVNWDAWRPYDEGADTQNEGPDTLFAMSAAEAVEVFDRLVAHGLTGQLVQSTGDLQTRLDQWVRTRPPEEQAASPPEETAGAHPRPALMVPYQAPTNEVEECIAGLWQELLGIAPIGIHDRFLDLGGHSLIAVQVVARLRQLYQINFSLSAMLASATVEELAIAVEMAIIDELEAAGHEEAPVMEMPTGIKGKYVFIKREIDVDN
jgi:acyl transferase domain-containing protein